MGLSYGGVKPFASHHHSDEGETWYDMSLCLPTTTKTVANCRFLKDITTLIRFGS